MLNLSRTAIASQQMAAPLPPPYSPVSQQPGELPGVSPYQVAPPQPPFAPLPGEPGSYGDPPIGVMGRTADWGASFWFGADYLLWWVKNGPQPGPLVVTGSPTDNFPGALDQPNTRVLYGNRDLNFGVFSGLRLNTGLWFGGDRRLGFELSGFMLGQNSTGYSASGGATGNPFIARPFVNAQTGNDNVYFVSQNFSDPNLTAMMTGSINISSSTRLWSWESNGLWNFYRGSNVSASFIAGFHSMGLREQLQIDESLRNLPGGGALTFNGAMVDPSSSVNTYDKFNAENTFYGGQIGTRLHYECSRFSLDVTGKAALGVSQEIFNIAGGSALFGPTGTVVSAIPGGVLAQGSNIGRYSTNKLAFAPEGDANLSYAITDKLILHAGYTFIYWNNVLRPGNQVDRTINPSFVPTDLSYGAPVGPARPTFVPATGSFWAQGLNLGVELRY
jgi:hypothetical protein